MKDEEEQRPRRIRLSSLGGETRKGQESIRAGSSSAVCHQGAPRAAAVEEGGGKAVVGGEVAGACTGVFACQLCATSQSSVIGEHEKSRLKQPRP